MNKAIIIHKPFAHPTQRWEVWVQSNNENYYGCLYALCTTQEDAREYANRLNDDGHRPHKFPPSDDDLGDVVAFKCASCGEWVSNFEPNNGCSINWRQGEVKNEN